MKNSYNSARRQILRFKKQTKDLNRHFSKEYEVVNEHMKDYSISLGKCTSKPRIPLLTGTAKTENKQATLSVAEDADRLWPWFLAGRNVKRWSRPEAQMSPWNLTHRFDSRSVHNCRKAEITQMRISWWTNTMQRRIIWQQKGTEYMDEPGSIALRERRKSQKTAFYVSINTKGPK